MVSPKGTGLGAGRNGADAKNKLMMRLGEDEPGELTPVMARLGPVDLETLDTLITAGFAANRAQAVRWALARIRERPAYAQLHDRAREIEELRSQFRGTQFPYFGDIRIALFIVCFPCPDLAGDRPRKTSWTKFRRIYRKRRIAS